MSRISSGHRPVGSTLLLALWLAASSLAIAPSARAATVPSAPMNVTAEGVDGAVELTWTAPESDGGSPITGYTVLVSPDALSVAISGSDNWADIDGLTNGRAYTFTVTANNANGVGPASEPSNSITPSAPPPPLGAPGPPLNVTAAAGDGTLSISWLPPTWDGGAPITRYFLSGYDASFGAFIYLGTIALPGSQTSVTFDENLFSMQDDSSYVFWVIAENTYDQGTYSQSSPVVPRAGAPAPQTAAALISPFGGAAMTDPDGIGPTPLDPVTTSVTVPATAEGGTLTIAETALDDAPTGFVFLGQQVEIVSTAPTDATHPLTIVFNIDPSLVPATIFRNGVPVEEGCNPAGTASPSPCIAAGAGTSNITILTAAASTWNVGLRKYDFSGFFSPVDDPPVVNSAKAGSAIPIRFGLGGDRGLVVLAAGYPRSVGVACDPTDPVDAIEETVSSPSIGLTYQAGTASYQYVWKSDRAWAGTCRQITIKLRDGSIHQALFKLK